VSAEAIIKSLLAADATVTALVSTRIFPAVVPENTALPALAVTMIAGARYPRIAGAETTHLQRTRMEVECVGTSYAEAKALRSAVIKACEFKRGTIATVLVHMIELIGEGPDEYDNSAEWFSQVVDFAVYFEAQ